MIGSYEDEQDLMEHLLYWQKRALKAEKEIERLKHQSIDEYVAQTMYNERRRGMIEVDGDR
jgi:hypothetical protein